MYVCIMALCLTICALSSLFAVYRFFSLMQCVCMWYNINIASNIVLCLEIINFLRFSKISVFSPLQLFHEFKLSYIRKLVFCLDSTDTRLPLYITGLRMSVNNLFFCLAYTNFIAFGTFRFVYTAFI